MSRHSQLMLARNFGSAKRRAPANLRSKPATLSRAIWFCAFAAACDRPACVIGALPVQCLEAGGPIREVILRQRVGHQSVAGPCIASRSAPTNADRLLVAPVLVPSGPPRCLLGPRREDRGTEPRPGEQGAPARRAQAATSCSRTPSASGITPFFRAKWEK